MLIRCQSPPLGQLFPILLAISSLLSALSVLAQQSPPRGTPEVLPEAPVSQIQSPVKPFHISYYHTLINTQTALNFQQPTGTSKLSGKPKYLTGRAPSPWLTSGYGKAQSPTVRHANHLEYYSHYFPRAASSILRVSEQAKAHPHVTSLFKLFQPTF